MKQYVVGFAFTTDGSVWLVRKQKVNVPTGWNGIGGKIEEGDATPAAAMSREWREETGTSWPESALEVCTLSGEGFEVHVFAARLPRVLMPTVNDVGETIDSFNPRMLDHTTVPNVHWLVPMAIEALDYPGRGAPYRVVESMGGAS